MLPRDGPIAVFTIARIVNEEGRVIRASTSSARTYYITGLYLLRSSVSKLWICAEARILNS